MGGGRLVSIGNGKRTTIKDDECFKRNNRGALSLIELSVMRLTGELCGFLLINVAIVLL